ncbi:hypothetical protein PFMALIP_03871 [Plasmodium falciparum MaliPS096_E11]|uniref:Uncharacterized protein n=1 Tax=Plasmodium falciparum MaliPS096_E11 TaxID=1036727 RepID=A0A024WNQ4_PLAFA|nr:hypothetical protein PFMALIP_03871 [Plasmodium falciparum MaliPS096_E11]
MKKKHMIIVIVYCIVVYFIIYLLEFCDFNIFTSDRNISYIKKFFFFFFFLCLYLFDYMIL